MTALGALSGGTTALVSSPPTQLWAPPFDLNEMITAFFSTAGLPDGPVSSLVDSAQSITATQGVSANRPVMSAAANAIQFSGAQSLAIPAFSDPWRYNRTIIALVQANITSANSANGSLISLNGSSGSQGARTPALNYLRSGGNKVQLQWGTIAGSDSIITLPWPDDTNLHLVVGRRVGGVSKASINGGTELTDGTNVVMARGGLAGIIGDIRNPSISWGLNSFLILQYETSDDMLARIQGYFMWLIGRQAALPPGHTYFSAPPTSNPFTCPYPFNSADEYNAIIPPYFASHLQDHHLESMTPWKSGLTLAFNEGCDDIACVADEAAPVGGTATLFAPVIDATGGSQINVSPTAAQGSSVFSQSGSILTLTMSQISGIWYSSTLATINIGGLGFAVDASKGPFFVETKVRYGTGNGQAVWGAPLWFEPVGRFFSNTLPYEELDVCETYNGEVHSSVAGCNYHFTEHYHQNARIYGARLASAVQSGKIFILDDAHLYPGTPPAVSLYDGADHLFQVYRDRNITICGLDDNELGRFPTMPFMCQPMFLMMSMNQLPQDAALASGTYTMGIDYLKAWQGTY